MFKQLLFWIKVSRPGLWFATIWLYLLPTGQMDIWQDFDFWLGFFYVCFPLNFLVYGWNDIVDQKIDLLNPRKDTFWFGAKGTVEELRRLWIPILVSNLVFLPYFIFKGGSIMIGVFLALTLINWLYNLPESGFRSAPPWELMCQFGYLLIVPFSILLNQTEALPWQTYFYLSLFAIQSHLIGEVMDIEPDRKTGRKTTATVIGMRSTKLLIIGIVAAEVFLLFYYFQEYIFGGMLLLALLWLIIDLVLIFKTQIYTLSQMKLFAILSNIVAILSMSYVWYSGCLLQVHR